MLNNYDIAVLLKIEELKNITLYIDIITYIYIYIYIYIYTHSKKQINLNISQMRLLDQYLHLSRCLVKEMLF